MNAQRRRDESAIRRELGDFDEIQYTDEGWDSRVYLVDRGQKVFKFARSPEVSAQYSYEIAALELLEAIDCPALIPRVRWRAPDLSYFGYEGVVGESLSNRIPSLDCDAKTKMGRSLGRFLKVLHGMELSGAPVLDVEREIANYDEKYRLASSTLMASLSTDALRMVQQFFTVELPIEMRRLGGVLRLGHGDLGPWNIIVTERSHIGVIDFGDVGYEDPSRDFSGFGDATIFAAACESYGADELLRERAALRMRAYPILDIPFYLGKRDEGGVRACIELVERVFVRGEQLHDARFKRG